MLRRLESNDLDASGRVVVTAFVTAPHRIDADVEKIVGRLSLEQSVSAARLQVEIHLDSEGHSALGLAAAGPQNGRPAG